LVKVIYTWLYLGRLGASQNNIWNSSWPKHSAQVDVIWTNSAWVDLICTNSAWIDVSWCTNLVQVHLISTNPTWIDLIGAHSAQIYLNAHKKILLRKPPIPPKVLEISQYNEYRVFFHPCHQGKKHMSLLFGTNDKIWKYLIHIWK